MSNNDSQALSLTTQAGQLGLVGSSTLSVPMPFETKIVLFESLRVAGTTHVSDIDTIMDEASLGDPITLVREPNNWHDEWAIRLEHNGKKIGYIPADKNELLARLLDGGKSLQASMVERELQGDWWKIYIEVSLVD